VRTAISRSARATTSLTRGLSTAAPAAFGIFPALAAWTACAIFAGLPWLPEMVRPLRELAGMERRRVSRVTGHEIPAPYRPAEGSWPQRARTILGDPATWRDLAWMLADGIPGVVAAVLAVALWPAVVYSLSLPLWWWAAPPGATSAFVTLTSWPQALTLPFAQAAVQAAALWWLVPRLAQWQLQLAERLLRPASRAQLAQRVRQLTETRAGALEAHAAELRRIERDLHDGTQAHLVSIAVRLGLAERSFAAQPQTALTLLHEAQDGVEDVLGHLRSVIRGIYPPILADRGLAGAVAALASGQPIPVAVRISGDLPRLPAAVEAAAYYITAEALTNVTKHSGATGAEVSVRRRGPSLLIMVKDNGRGGADPAHGSGLGGIRHRVAALDGRTRIHSPAGHGTTIEVELPCE
jgi:signal transduction histidine kinase